MIGQTLSHYEILDKLGSGGMGDVYRARDTKLGRDVAVKVLSEAFARDKDRFARFEREARVLASLNHPNIATIHGLEQSDGVHFLVLELAAGETLEERISRGSIPFEEAIPLFTQIAEALAAAHEKDIIHRDLKPANVKVTSEGTVKVLDFGLAKALVVEPPADIASQPGLSEAPTLTRHGTQHGMILGTAPYMSPEQARGRAVDKRSDIWSFGCVLYEALSGKRPFGGETVTDTLAAVVRAEPDWSLLPPTLPWKLRDLLKRCLRKNPSERLHDIVDARIEIVESLMEPTAAPELPVKRIRPSLTVIVLTALLASAVTGLVLWSVLGAPRTSTPTPARLAVNLPSSAPADSERLSPIALSPDGSNLVYTSTILNKRQLFLRPLKELDPSPIPGTERAIYPFFSPDGQWIGFFAEGLLKKVPVRGGTPVNVCEALQMRGGSWGPDGHIYFATLDSRAIWKVAASGGSPERVRAADEEKGERELHWPEILPNGEALLFTVWTGNSTEDSTAVLSLKSRDTKPVIKGGYGARYVPTGHLVYSQENSLFVVPFDLDRLTVTGGPVPVVDQAWEPLIGSPGYSFSQTGTLAYVPQVQTSLTWIDRQGASEPLMSVSSTTSDISWANLEISPDGRRMAASIQDDIWIIDLTRGTRSRFTFDPAREGDTAWSPDGERLAFSSSREGGWSLYWKPTDGSGDAEKLVSNGEGPLSWSRDGRHIAFRREQDIWILPTGGEREPWPFVETPFQESTAQFSPDGKWLAMNRTSPAAERSIYSLSKLRAGDGKYQPREAGSAGGHPMETRFSISRRAESWRYPSAPSLMSISEILSLSSNDRVWAAFFSPSHPKAIDSSSRICPP